VFIQNHVSSSNPENQSFGLVRGLLLRAAATTVARPFFNRERKRSSFTRGIIEVLFLGLFSPKSAPKPSVPFCKSDGTLESPDRTRAAFSSKVGRNDCGPWHQRTLEWRATRSR